MTNWIEHNGGPQPVGDDVWVELRDDHVPFDIHLAKWVDWGHALQYRILNEHLIDAKQAEIDAARLEGIRLGLEAADNAIKALYDERDFNILRTRKAVRALNPDTIAREAQDMGSDTSASTSA